MYYNYYSDDQGQKWDVRTLWEAANLITPVLMQIDMIADMADFMDCSCWSKPGEMMTMRQIIHHCDRIMNADLSYPIILTPNGFICDGCHRLSKAILLKHTHILAVKLEVMPAAIL